MVAPRRRCLDYSKVYYVTGRWLLAWNQNKYLTYYIFHILIPKSVLVFFNSPPLRLMMTPTSSLRGSSP